MNKSFKRIVAAVAFTTVSFGSVSVFAARGRMGTTVPNGYNTVGGRRTVRSVNRLRTVVNSRPNIHEGCQEVYETYLILKALPEGVISDGEITRTIESIAGSIRSQFKKPQNTFDSELAKMTAALTNDDELDAIMGSDEDEFCFEKALYLVSVKYAVWASGGSAYENIPAVVESKFERKVDFTKLHERQITRADAEIDEDEEDEPMSWKEKAMWAVGILGGTWLAFKYNGKLNGFAKDKLGEEDGGWLKWLRLYNAPAKTL